MGTVRDWFAGRWLSGGLALLGVLLVVPSLLSPTWEMSVSDREHGSLLSRQWEWSWGRVRVTIGETEANTRLLEVAEAFGAR